MSFDRSIFYITSLGCINLLIAYANTSRFSAFCAATSFAVVIYLILLKNKVDKM